MNATRADLIRLRRINRIAVELGHNPRTMARCREATRRLANRIAQRTKNAAKPE